MNKQAAFLLISAIFCASAAPAAAVSGTSSSLSNRWPHQRERGAYQVRVASTGEVLWNVRWDTQVTEQDGVMLVEVREQGNGRPWRHKEPIIWSKRMVFEAGPEQPGSKFANDMQFRSVEGTGWDLRGKLLNQVNMHLDPATREILYRNADVGKPEQSTVIQAAPAMFPDELLFHWARALPFDALPGQGSKSEFMLLVSPTRQFRIQAQVRGAETVTTPAGTFSCYRVDLTPKLIGPLKALAPKMALWCSTEAPHYWVRYQGPVGGPGSPQAIIELVEFHQEKPDAPHESGL